MGLMGSMGFEPLLKHVYATFENEARALRGPALASTCGRDFLLWSAPLVVALPLVSMLPRRISRSCLLETLRRNGLWRSNILIQHTSNQLSCKVFVFFPRSQSEQTKIFLLEFIVIELELNFILCRHLMILSTASRCSDRAVSDSVSLCVRAVSNHVRQCAMGEIESESEYQAETDLG